MIPSFYPPEKTIVSAMVQNCHFRFWNSEKIEKQLWFDVYCSRHNDDPQYQLCWNTVDPIETLSTPIRVLAWKYKY
jgi:hypothetical protein